MPDEVIVENDGHGESDSPEEIALRGAFLKVEDLKREDGLITRPQQSYQSLLHAVIHAIEKNQDYRQELKVALFANSDESDLLVSAIAECHDLGMDETPIIDQMIARSAGKNHDLLYKIFDTLTHSTFTSNVSRDKKRSESRSGSSPLST
jgi:hypothetical protein